jgi:shikimate dehydrogenase
MKEICDHRFAYVDLELEADEAELDDLARVAHHHGAKVIVSHHFAEAKDVHRASEVLEACGARGDIAKVATPIADFGTAIQLIDLARARANRPPPIVLIGTGTMGMVTRALTDALREEIQYASWGSAAAPGQLPLATAARLRGREPMILGLVGHPLEHSLSPVIHETALAALNLPAVYLPMDIPLDFLDQFLLALDRLHIRGFNVTHPLKESLAQRVDELDADAERLGAVNTVVVRDGWTVGHNTDVYGFRVSLRALGLRVGERTALVVGAGGAARAVVHVLLREGASVQVTNRTIARAEALADSFDDPVAVVPMEALQRAGPWDLLVNATPIGMKGPAPGLPVPEAVVAKAAFVYDLVYNPTATPLLQAARRLNRPGTSGLDMLLHQAAKAFELWTGQSPPFDAMRRAVKEALR